MNVIYPWPHWRRDSRLAGYTPLPHPLPSNSPICQLPRSQPHRAESRRLIRLKYPRRPIRPVCSCNRIDDVALRKPDQYSNVLSVLQSSVSLVGWLFPSPTKFFSHLMIKRPQFRSQSDILIGLIVIDLIVIDLILVDLILVR